MYVKIMQTMKKAYTQPSICVVEMAIEENILLTMSGSTDKDGSPNIGYGGTDEEGLTPE